MTEMLTQQKKKTFPFSNIPEGFFPPLFLNYLAKHEALTPFYNHFPSLASFEQQIGEKKNVFSPTARQVLFETLNKQYKNLTLSTTTMRHLESLTNTNTFTVTTGHQLNIFTGPLYVIYKIVSTINLCKTLKQAYPHFNFVPIYWMASEDHDFDEISKCTIHGKTYTWQTPQQGRVGRFDPKSMQPLLDKIPGDITLFREAYLSHQYLSDAVRYYMNELFGQEGLIVLDADCHALKKHLRPVMLDDFFQHTPQTCIHRNNRQLKERGYSLQIHPRNINLFYVDRGVRSRIVREQDRFSVWDTELAFDAHRLREKIHHTPEQFSPNVALRPLYQEMILPNIAYVGGPSEIAYWFQLKQLFEHYQTPFPILVPRNFALVVDGPTTRTWEKTTFPPCDLFKPTSQLHAQWVDRHTKHHLRLEREQRAFRTTLDQIEQKATRIDSTLQGMAQAEAHRMLKSLKKIEYKMLRAEKRKHGDALRQINRVKNTLFPGGTMQERVENFLTFYQTDPDFIQQLLRTFDPLDFRFQVLYYPFV